MLCDERRAAKQEKRSCARKKEQAMASGDRAFVAFYRLERTVVAALERGFEVLMDDLTRHPVLLFFFGMGAGGLLGAAFAAFSIGYVAEAMLRQSVARAALGLVVVGVWTASCVVPSLAAAPLPLAPYCLGRDMRIFFGGRRLTLFLAAMVFVSAFGSWVKCLPVEVFLFFMSFRTCLSATRACELVSLKSLTC